MYILILQVVTCLFNIRQKHVCMFYITYSLSSFLFHVDFTFHVVSFKCFAHTCACQVGVYAELYHERPLFMMKQSQGNAGVNKKYEIL